MFSVFSDLGYFFCFAAHKFMWCMQVMNHLDESVTVFWSKDGEAQAASNIDSVESGQTLPLPLICFDYPNGGIFLQPDIPK